MTSTVKDMRHKNTHIDCTFLPNNFSRRQVAILNGKDWTRIKNRVENYNPEVEKSENQRRDREYLSQLSKDRVKKWDNTIEGQRLRKLQARKIKLQQDEVERQKIDVKEAKLQAQNRKEAIERAKRQQYMQTDRVKGFHSALTLTEVLKERDAQINMKKSKRNWEREKDDALVQQQKQNFLSALQEEEEEAKNKFELALQNAEFQKEQVNDRRRCNEEERQEDIKEGQAIKEQYEIYKAAMEAIQKRHKEYQLILRDTYVQQMKYKKKRLEDEKIKDAEIDKENKKFVTAKRKMALLRKEKENELFEAFQNHTAKIRNQLQLEMRGRVDDEDIRIAKAVMEEENKRLAEEKRTEEAKNESILTTHELRLRMIHDHEVERKENMLKDKAFLQRRMMNDKEFKEKMEANKKKRREDAIKVQDFYNYQMKKEKEERDKKKKEALELDARNTALVVEEEEIFQSYADQVISDAKAGNRNLFPLIKARKEGPGGGRGPIFNGKAGLRPSYIVEDATGVQLPHYHRDSSIQNSVYGHVGKTENRLGFNWKNQFV